MSPGFGQCPFSEIKFLSHKIAQAFAKLLSVFTSGFSDLSFGFMFCCLAWVSIVI